MKITTATIYGGLLQSCALFKRPFKWVANTTLNEKFGVQSGVKPGAGEMPAVGYVCIGRGGHRNVTGADGGFYTNPRRHKPSDAGLYEFLPFALVPMDADLTKAERDNYALRKLVNVGGVNYWAYYLRRISLVASEPNMWINTVNGDDVKQDPFVPTSDNLNPTPDDLDSTQVTTSSGQYLSVNTPVEISFTAKEIKRIIDACKILFDNEGYAIISEIGLVSGVDRVVSATAQGNQSFDFTEVISAQIVAHLTTYHNLPSANNGVKEVLDLGTTEPMLLTTDLASGAAA